MLPFFSFFSFPISKSSSFFLIFSSYFFLLYSYYFPKITILRFFRHSRQLYVISLVLAPCKETHHCSCVLLACLLACLLVAAASASRTQTSEGLVNDNISSQNLPLTTVWTWEWKDVKGTTTTTVLRISNTLARVSFLLKNCVATHWNRSCTSGSTRSHITVSSVGFSHQDINTYK